MAVSSRFIYEDRRAQGSLALHDVAILDFLNSVKNADELNRHIIQDDPDKFPLHYGYGIGETVADRIIAKRKELGQFNSFEDLSDIKGFGPDKFHDLVYTFVKLRIPLPSGRGARFDTFIAAVGALENAFNGSTTQFITALRKLFHVNKTGIEESYDLDWSEVLKSANHGVPGSWWSSDHLLNAVNFIKHNPEILIDNIPVNVHTLLTGLDARRHPGQVTTTGDFDLDANEHYATYLNPLSWVQLAFIREGRPNLNSANVSFDDEKLRTAFLSNMTFGQYYAAADAFALPLDADRALVWNLLNYYTEAESPIKERFIPLIEALDLGTVRDQRFANQLEAFPRIQRDVLQSYLYLGQQNGRSASELAAMDEQEADTALFGNLHSIATSTTDLFIDILAFLVAAQESKPSVLTWNRLEARPRTEEFTRPMAAQIRDPLWMLCRQYQLGEFHGEDAGSPIESRLQLRTSRVQNVALGEDQVKPYGGQLPLEMMVEQQAAPIDLLCRIEVARQWQLLFGRHATDQNIPADDQAEIRDAFRAKYPLAELYATEEVATDAGLKSTLSLLARTGQFDAFRLFEELENGRTLGEISGQNVPGQGELAQNFMDWVRAHVLPAHYEHSKAWHSSHLEYQTACAIPSDKDAVAVVVADEYPGGHLDWYAFDHQPDPAAVPVDLVPSDPDDGSSRTEVLTTIPGIITYSGMPLPRWWQMEDSAINFDQLNIDKSDSATLAFAEFATLYSNDWFMVPHVVANGSLCEIKHLVVKDVFGQYTRIEAAGGSDPNGWQRWALFDLHQRGNPHQADHRLFLPPSLARSYESEPVEQVNFLRDEMANMVWAIERVIPDGMAGGYDGFEAATRLRKYLTEQAEAAQGEVPDELIPNEAKIKYRLGTEVPENWIPFIPTRKMDAEQRSIQLQRAAMPRVLPGQATKRVRPKTSLLRQNYHPEAAQKWKPYYVYEEEIPRSGSLLTQRWQRTRWYNGKRYLWLANHKRNGTGQSSSGLQFDQVSLKR